MTSFYVNGEDVSIPLIQFKIKQYAINRVWESFGGWASNPRKPLPNEQPSIYMLNNHQSLQMHKDKLLLKRTKHILR